MKRTDKDIRKTVMLLALLLVPVLSLSQEATQVDSLTASKVVAQAATPATALRKVERPAIDAVISPLGEADAVKYIQRLPGVSSGMEGTSSFSVRGGNSGNNLISLDGVTLYGATHMFGLSSTVPSSVLSGTDFCIGGFDGDDGNLLGAHIRMSSMPGSYSKVRGEVSLSNIMGTAAVSAPLWKDRVSLMVSGRWSPAQMEYNLLAPKFAGTSTGLPSNISAKVFDLYAKLSGRISDGNEINLSYFKTADGYAFSNASLSSRDSLGWANDIALLDWKWTVSNRMAVHASVSRNAFSSIQDQVREGSRAGVRAASLSLQSKILEYKASAGVDIEAARGIRVGMGVEFRKSSFSPAALKSTGAENDVVENHALATRLAAAYLQASYSRGGFLAKASVRLSSFAEGADYRKLLPEGHFLLDWFFVNNLGLELTYDRLVQFYHTLEGIPTGFSADMVVPSGSFAAPETAHQVYLGLMSSIGKEYQFSAGGYYKTMDGLVFLKEADKFFSVSAASWRENLSTGKGTSYGLETYIRKSGEPFSGQIAYTLSKTDRSFPEIYSGGSFPAQFDRRHILNADARYSIGRGEKPRHSISAAFTFSSGHYQTLQAGRYPSWLVTLRDELVFYTRPNNYRLPPYIRLDIAYQLDIKGKRMDQQLMFGIYNVMNRHNAFSLTWDSEAQRWKKVSILPIMPNIKYILFF